MNAAELERFEHLRRDLFAALQRSLESGGGGKSYEGAFEIHFPKCWLDEWDEEPWTIRLHCYLMGPSRHYYWTGNTFGAALEKCENDVRKWIQEDEDDE